MRRGIVLFLIPLALAAQSRPEDLCSIEGLVFNAASGEPVRKANLVLRRVNTNPAAPGNYSYGTTSDAAGKFAMKDIEPGQYRLTVDRAGFANMEYGARNPGRAGTILSLSRAQSLMDLVFRLTPHGVIVDQGGEPVARALVQLARYRYLQGRKQLGPGNDLETTNDLGEYRIFGVAPGRYYLTASYRASREAILDRSAAPPSEEDYVPTYYPGTTDVSTATELNVTPGGGLRNVDFTLSKAHTVRIRGRVTSSVADVGPPRYVTLRPRSGIVGPLQNSPYPVDSSGRFEIRGVAPGSYLLWAQFQGGRSLRQSVEVGNSNLDDLNLTLGPSVEIHGRARIDPNTPAGVSGIRLTLRSRDSGGIFVNPPSTNLKQDGTFQLEEVNPHRYNLAFSGLPEGFYVKAIRSGDSDVLVSGVDLMNGADSDIEVILSPNAGQISGVVQNPKTQLPSPAATVVLIPEEKERRDQQLYYKIAETDQSGSFTLKGLVPGTYTAFAWEDIEADAYLDPDFVKPFESSGQSVVVAESGQFSLQLTLILADSSQ